MAEIIWAATALSDLEAIAEFIALENPEAAAEVVTRVFRHVDQLQMHPNSGPRVPELKRSRYRQLIEPPCRVFYRYDGKNVFIVHVMRSERLLRISHLTERQRPVKRR
jgi:toxin ParE1/3/4